MLGDSGGPVLGDRRMKAAGTANSLGINTGTKPADGADKEKKAAAPGEEATEELPPFGDKSLARDKSIRGRVLDAEGKPVPDAVVLAAYKDTDSYPYALVPASRVRSEEDGSFVLGPLGRRTFWILAIKKEVGVAFVSDKAPGAVVELILSPGARITGTVTDQETGKPVANARVAVTDWSFWDEASTDAEGKYLLAPVPPTVNMWSGHRVLVMADGFERAERNNLILKNKVEQSIDFRLKKGKTLAGKVFDAQTLQPIAEAVVAEGWEDYHKTSTTDEQGAFSLPNVDTAPNRMFTVRAKGYLPHQRQSDGTGTLEFKLNKSEVLEGKVLDRKDNPVPGARVYLHRIKYEQGHKPSGRSRWRNMTVSDEKGVFRFENVLPGQVACVAFDKDSAPGEFGPITVQLGVPPPVDIKVTLREGVTVEGEVRDTQDNPIPNIKVELQRWFFQAKGYKWVTRYVWYENPSWYSDEKGKFILKGAIPGSLWLSVWDTNYGWTGKQVKGEEGQRIDGLILSFAGESIEGIFLDHNGEPVPGAWINAQGPKNTPQKTWRWTSTDALGRFKLAGLKPGDYDLKGSLHNSQAEPLKDIPAGTTGVELKLKSTQVLRGSVLSVLSGRPLTQFMVQINVQKAPGRRNRGGTSWSGEIKSPDGKFERPVKPGTYTVVVKSRGHAPQVINGVVVEEHVPPQEQHFQLDQGGGIQGVLRGADGKPLKSHWIQAQVLRSPGEQRQPYDHMMGGYDTTDMEGRYFIEGVAPGSYRIQVNMGNRGSATAVVSVSGSENVRQDLQLVPAGYVVFKALDKDTGDPIRNVYFQIHDPNTNAWVGWSRQTDANGSSRSNPLRAGEARVTPYHGQYVSEPFIIHIESSKTINVTVEMKKKPKPAPK
ncbi:MAG: carboxypeptidase regulatory-like domain-containing protein [Planctomycetota bacterium]